mgnify:CR=1 FL=1
MGILSRFKDIMSSNINALLDKAENPEKMIDQYLINAKKDLAAVRRETAGVMAEEKRAKMRLDEEEAQVEKLTELAKRALQAGNREDAEVLISKKQLIEEGLPEYIEIYESSVKNANQMREMHNKLATDIEAMERRKDAMKGKIAATRAKETVNKMGAASDKYGATLGKMGDLEAKVEKQYNMAMSEGELLNEPVDSVADIEKKYSGSNPATVSSELDALEVELGLRAAEKVEKEIEDLEE